MPAHGGFLTDPAGSCMTKSPLGAAVHDFITSFHLNPLGNGMILLSFLSQKSVDPESLGRRQQGSEPTTRITMAEKGRGRQVL